MLPYARLHLHALVDTPLRLPDYAGSTLRGAFGGGGAAGVVWKAGD